MKKSIKKLVIVLILNLIIGILLTTQVMAYSFNMIATPSVTTIKEGETVTITLGIKDIDAGELGINTIETEIEYDSDIFEEVKQEDIKSKNNWSLTYNGGSNGGKILGIILSSGVKEDQNSIGEINLKLKTGIKATETTIKFTKITTNNGTELITNTDKEIKLTVGSANEKANEDKDDSKEKATNTEVSTNTKDITTATTIIPAAGVKTVMIIIGVSILAISTIVCILKIKKMKQIK